MLLHGMRHPYLMAEESAPPGGGGTDPPPAASPAPAATTPGDGSTGFTALDWRSDLPPDLQAAPWLKDYASKEAAIKGLGDLKSYQGRSVGIPGKDAKPEDWTRVYDRLGRPKTAEEYDIPSPVGTEGAPWWTDDLGTGLKGIAHKVGLNNTQAATFVQEVAQFLGAGHNRQEASKVEATAQTQRALSELWGGAKVQNLHLAQQAVKRFGDGETDLWSFFEDTGLGNNVGFIQFLHRIGSLLPEDTYVGDALGPLPTISELDSQIQTTMSELFAAQAKGGGKASEVAQAKLKSFQQQKAAQLERQQAQAHRRMA